MLFPSGVKFVSNKPTRISGKRTDNIVPSKSEDDHSSEMLNLHMSDHLAYKITLVWPTADNSERR